MLDASAVVQRNNSAMESRFSSSTLETSINDIVFFFSIQTQRSKLVNLAQLTGRSFAGPVSAQFGSVSSIVMSRGSVRIRNTFGSLRAISKKIEVVNPLRSETALGATQRPRGGGYRYFQRSFRGRYVDEVSFVPPFLQSANRFWRHTD